MDMHDPSTPGEILAGWLEDLDMSVTAFAAHVGISRVMLSRILNGHAAVKSCSQGFAITAPPPSSILSSDPRP